MGEISELWVIMLIIALASFAPLGLFIYRFTNKSEDPLGNLHGHHKPSAKIETLVNSILGLLLSKK